MTPDLMEDGAQRYEKIAPQLVPGQSVITASGYWLGTNWSLQAGAQQQDNYLLREERLGQLTQELATAEQHAVQLSEQYTAQQSALQQAQQQQQHAMAQLQQAGYLEAIYMMLASQSQFARLIGFKNQLLAVS